jgi:hypothetical protein
MITTDPFGLSKRFQAIDRDNDLFYDNVTKKYYKGITTKMGLGACKKCAFWVDNVTDENVELQPCREMPCRSNENADGQYRYWMVLNTYREPYVEKVREVIDNRTDEEKSICELILG